MKNFSRAAEKLNISQPALSKRISNLERELNTLLINRDSRNMEITQSGRLVYQTANEILQKVDAMVQSIDNINSGVKGTVKVCFPRSVHLGTLRDAIIIMSNEYPDIVVTCTCENSSHEVIEKLAKNEVDIAYMNQGDIPVSKDFIVDTIIENDVCILVSTKHPLATKDSVTFDDLCEETLVFPGGSGISLTLGSTIQLFEDNGFNKNDFIFVNDVVDVYLSVSSGAYVGIGGWLSKDIDFATSNSIVKVLLKNSHIHTGDIVSVHRNKNKHNELFVSCLMRAGKNH